MNKKLVSNVLTGIMLAGSMIIGNKAETQAETFKNVLQPIPESVLIEHLDKEIIKSKEGAFPSSVDISTSKYFPTIQNQGKLGSCAAFSTVYYQFSYEANKLNNVNSKDLNNCYSPKWAYNSLNSGENNGVSMDRVYQFLKDYGSMRWKGFPYDTGIRQGQNKAAVEAYTNLPGKSYADKMREALGCRLSDWNSYKIQGTGTAITSNKDTDLDVVKSLLVHGHPLTVQVDCDWDIRKSPTWGYVIVSCAQNADGHGMTVVGYDDSVWFDVNGNGSKEPGECGAFKVANSWGVNSTETNEGFVWVLYDALNGESAIPNYTRADGKERVPMFAKGYTDNYFLSITVENKKVEFVAEVSYYADMLNQLNVLYGKSVKSANAPKSYHGYGLYNLSQPSAHDGINIVDMGDVMDSIVTDYRGYKWYLRVCDFDEDKNFIRNITCRVTDNLGNTISNVGNISAIDGQIKTFATNIDLKVGDVNYSGTVNSDDAVLVLQYFAGTQKFSNVQMFLGDCNGDGKVNSDDAQLILSNFAGM